MMTTPGWKTSIMVGAVGGVWQRLSLVNLLPWHSFHASDNRRSLGERTITSYEIMAFAIEMHAGKSPDVGR